MSSLVVREVFSGEVKPKWTLEEQVEIGQAKVGAGISYHSKREFS